MITSIGGANDTARHDVRRAWLANLLFIPSTVAAFVVGEGLFTLVGGDETHWWAPVVAGLPALLVFALPCVVVGRYALRAGGADVPHAELPFLLALTITFGFGGLNLVSLVAQRF